MANPKIEQRVEDDEHPVRSANGVVLANSAYRCKPVDLWPTEMKTAKPEWLPPMEEYLKDFARPVRTIADEIRCLACDKQVTGAHVHLQDWRHKDALTFNPDPKTTMEGRCNGCGYPVRCHHAIFMPDGGPLLVRLMGFPLFYHPDSTSKIN